MAKERPISRLQVLADTRAFMKHLLSQAQHEMWPDSEQLIKHVQQEIERIDQEVNRLKTEQPLDPDEELSDGTENDQLPDDEDQHERE